MLKSTLTDTNPCCVRCMIVGFVSTLIVFLLTGLYIILKDNNSILGASLVLTGGIGLMFTVVMCLFHCFLGTR